MSIIWKHKWLVDGRMRALVRETKNAEGTAEEQEQHRFNDIWAGPLIRIGEHLIIGGREGRTNIWAT